MAGEITFGQLRAKCRFDLLTILECGIHAVYGEHTRAEIRAVVNRKEAEAALTDIAEESIEILSMDSGNDGDAVARILFAGVIEGAEITEEGKYATISLRAVSRTWKMDIEKKSRSFQKVSMTYREAAEEIMREYGGNLIWNIPDKQLEYPMIQYKETDYDFLRRMLRRMGRGLTAEDCAIGAYVHAGIRDGSYKGEIKIKEYIHSLIPFCGKAVGGPQEERQRGYRMEDMGFMRVGDSMRIQGKLFYVMEVHAVSVGNVLKCDCLVFPQKCFEAERIPAKTLRGAVLTGKVLETGQERVKLHLDIDKEQAVAEAYEFPWKPITGNLMYCMPEVGTKAALYFDRSEEKDAAVIYSIRENGEWCRETADYNDRYLTTDGGRRMYLKPSEMGLLNMPEQNARIELKDGAVLNMKTGHKISILAEGQVQMKGKRVTLIAPKEATLVRKDLIAPTVINMCNAFDAIGKMGNFAAAPQVIEKKRKKTAPSQKAEKYVLSNATENILSNIPADDVDSPIMEQVVGSMPTISRMRGEKGGNYR